MALPQQLRCRYAHAPGPTFLAYTPNGSKLITAGVDNFCRVFSTGSDEEPSNVDDCQENNLSLAAGDGFFITGAEDGTVNKYSLGANDGGDIVWRSTLPVRDVALSPDGNWVAVASDELVVHIINIKDIQIVKRLRDQNRSVKHVSFNRTGTQLAVSCVDGSVYVYSVDTEEPELIQKVDNMIKRLEPEAESSSRVLWHPDGKAFATPTGLREIQVMSTSDWERQKTFKTGHTADITAAAWSPNGALLATTSGDLNLCLWHAKTQELLKKYDDVKATILAMAWHPTQNILSYTNTEGHLYIHNDFVPPEHEGILRQPLQSAPFFHDPSEGRSRDATTNLTNGTKTVLPERRARAGSLDSLDDLLGDEFRDEDADMADEADDFVIDDDGAGYTNAHGKRTNGHLGPLESISKRRPTAPAFQPQIHEPFQPGGTPWRGSRRLLCCSLVGYVSTISQEDTHHTVEVKFYDEQAHHNFRFTDVFGYDKAALTEHGTLFSCQPKDNTPAMIYYRPHETWTARADWRTNLPAGESVTAIALSDSYVVVTTSTNYVRIYSLFGLPIRVFRQKASPAVTCAAWRDYVLTIGNGPVGGDGTCQLLYTIENVKRDEIYQSEDIVALPPNTTLTSVFFSAEGDPYIYDSDGVLLTLLHWRTNGQARWIPMLDTKCLPRRVGGGKQESYWPVCVARDADGKHVFHCMIIKGSERYPSNPPPMLSEFPLEVPLSSSIDKSREQGKAKADMDDLFDDEDEAAKKPENKQQQHEQDYVLSSTLHAQLAESLAYTRPTAHQKQDLVNLEVQIDRALLQLLGLECLAGEDRGMKALELVTLMRDANGKMLELAGKVAQRYGRDVLREKIGELAERRMMMGVGEEDEL